MFVRKLPRHVLTTLLAVALTLAACNVGAAPSPTLDANAINTAIVGTTVAQLSAQFTQTALAAPQATSTSLPTITPQTLPTFALPTTDSSAALPTVSFATTPTAAGIASPLPGFTQLPSSVPTKAQDSCFNSVYEADITISDGTEVKGGETFEKIWRIRNTGSCTWDEGFTLVYVGGSPGLGATNYQFRSNDVVPSGQAIDIGVGVTAPCAQGKQEGHWRMQTDAGGNNYFGTYLSLYIVVSGKTGGCS